MLKLLNESAWPSLRIPFQVLAQETLITFLTHNFYRYYLGDNTCLLPHSMYELCPHR